MKFLRLTLVAMLLTTVLFSCGKSSDKETTPTPTPGITGKWVGHYGFGNETPAVSYILNVRPDGKVEELNTSGASKGDGPWSLTGSTFNGHYTWKAPMNTVFTVVATYDATNHKLVGTWGYDDNATNGGLKCQLIDTPRNSANNF